MYDMCDITKKALDEDRSKNTILDLRYNTCYLLFTFQLFTFHLFHTHIHTTLARPMCTTFHPNCVEFYDRPVPDSTAKHAIEESVMAGVKPPFAVCSSRRAGATVAVIMRQNGNGVIVDHKARTLFKWVMSMTGVYMPKPTIDPEYEDVEIQIMDGHAAGEILTMRRPICTSSIYFATMGNFEWVWSGKPLERAMCVKVDTRVDNPDPPTLHVVVETTDTDWDPEHPSAETVVHHLVRRVWVANSHVDIPYMAERAARLRTLETLDTDQLDQLDQQECAICVEDICSTHTCTRIVECRHVFHTACLNGWLWANSTCPMCRTECVGNLRGNSMMNADATMQILLPHLSAFRVVFAIGEHYDELRCSNCPAAEFTARIPAGRDNRGTDVIRRLVCAFQRRLLFSPENRGGRLLWVCSIPCIEEKGPGAPESEATLEATLDTVCAWLTAVGCN